MKAYTMILYLLLYKSAFSQCATYEPPDGKVILIIGQDCNATGGTIYGNGYINDAQLGLYPPAGITTYYSLSLTPGAGLNSVIDYGAGPLHSSQYIGNSSFTNAVICIGLYMTDGAGNTLNLSGGAYNPHLDALANWIKSVSPRPVFLRIGYEFETQYANNPANYIAAWRYIVDRFRNQSVNNVSYVWQAAAGNGGTNYLLNWYPGDNYVDWLAYSHFEYGGNQFEGNDIITLARQKRKPVMIAEATPRGYNLANATSATAAWSNYFVDLFSKINTNIDVIKALCYINQDWDAQTIWNGQGWGNSRIQANGNGTIEANWIAEISKSHWLHATTTLFATLQSNGQQPYAGTPPLIPGIIEAENFDEGCEGDAYKDNTGGNAGNSSYRFGSSVDIGTTADASGRTVAFTSSGEWLEYTVNIASTASYKFTFRIATLNTGNTFHLEVNGINATGTINVPATSGWDTYTDLVVGNIALNSGTHVFRIVFDNTPGFNLNYFSVDTPAPVEIGAWHATRIKSDVQLQWETWNEVNNLGFEIEKSFDGNAFQSLVFIDAKGTQNTHSQYSYYDLQSIEPLLYYRLIQHDKNGEKHFYKTLLVENTNEPEIFPNPHSETFTIRNLSGNAQVKIYDAQGKLFRESITDNGGSHSISGLSKGFYILKILTADKQYVFSVIHE